MVKYSPVNQSANVHLIVGEDDYLVETAARKILDAAVPSSLRETALEVVDGSADNAETQMASLRACRGSIETPPFLDPVKATWWKRVTFLPGGGKGGVVSQEVKTALENFAASLAKAPPPPNQTLVITATRLLQSSIFAKAMKTFATVVAFASGGKARDRRERAEAMLPDLAKAENLTFRPAAAAAFIARAGTDTRTLVSEIAKLRTYIGMDRNEVTEQDVRDITSVASEDPELWELSAAVATRSPARVMGVLARYSGAEKIGILLATVMEKFFRELIVCRDAIDRGWLNAFGWKRDMPEDVREMLDATGFGPGAGKAPFMIKNSVSAAKAFTPRELTVAHARFVAVREKLVSGGTDDLVKIELMRIVKPRK